MSHRFIPSSGDATDGLDPSHAAAIKRWAADCLHLGPDDVVTVSELRCGDAGCPLVETVITVFGSGPARRWTLIRPKVAVTRLMVQQTLASAPATPRG